MKGEYPSRSVVIGDNLEVLSAMNTDTIDLIYLDPPFNSKRNYTATKGSVADGAEFSDGWGRTSVDLAWRIKLARDHSATWELIQWIGKVNGKASFAYLAFLAVRLIELHRVLKDTGSIYLHVDPTSSHSLKMIMDSIFGEANYQNEVVWLYDNGGRAPGRYAKKHDVILYYSKVNGQQTFNTDDVRVPYNPTSNHLVYGTKRNGKHYKPHPMGKMLPDYWSIPPLNQCANDRTGWPTQKPIDLITLIVKASSKPGDVVLDPFAGSGTTLLAAEGQGRGWVGIERHEKAREVIQARFNELGEIATPRLAFF